MYRLNVPCSISRHITEAKAHWGSCSSAGRAGRLVIGRFEGSNPGSPQLHVEVSWSKILNPKLLLMSSRRLAWQPLPSAYECVNVASIVKCFERSVDRKSKTCKKKKKILCKTTRTNKHFSALGYLHNTTAVRLALFTSARAAHPENLNPDTAKCVRANSLSMGPLSDDVSLQRGRQTKGCFRVPPTPPTPSAHGTKGPTMAHAYCVDNCVRVCVCVSVCVRVCVCVCVCVCLLLWETVWLRQCSMGADMSKQTGNRLAR